ncbi:long-chain-fatty-acid--CoA ligase [Achromobacter sp. GG226]|uniref:long-chain-fatty-acid--CoA ligase n=1 Tax=Verticiella alkaliphila TaxID=2779529 RepID=UPI001C0D36AD|nr:long-chain-fatty-acid--CoA ligase [Verticiella sp. GG226]MBU4611000.1 long-chain-fatty-acid--CoA ligase [Verticiella sp. GG226]
MSLTQSIHRAVQQGPDRLATVCGTRRQTYRELAARAARLAGALRALGVAEGDRVALMAVNSAEYAEFIVGTWWAGAVANPVNNRWSAPEVAYSLRDCETEVLIVDDEHLDRVPAILAEAPGVRTVVHIGTRATPEGMLAYEPWLAAAEPVADAARPWDSLAVILYTGGTTGFPKGVMLSHLNLWSSAVGRMAEFPALRDSVTLLVPPLFHTAALGKMITQFITGGASVMAPTFRTGAVMQAIQDEKVNDIMLVPSMIQMLLDDPTFNDYDMRSLRRITYGASPISASVLERAMICWPGTEFFQAYGMTETAPVISISGPEDHGPEARESGRYRSAGRSCFGVEVRIVDDAGNELPRGTVGEIIARGPNVMMGYWKLPEATAEALRGGWMHTGDGAYMDEAGYIYIVDRLKDMIVSGGENVYSAEVENVLARHPGVQACAVIGVPHEKWGEAVHAIVVPRAGHALEAAQLQAFCRERLAGYKCPKTVDVAEALPMSPAGKVLKQVLRKPFWDGRDRKVS